MSYGTSESAGKTFLNFKIVTQENIDGKKVKVDPYFSINSRGEDDKFHVHEDRPQFVTGNLTKLKLGSFQWEEQDVNTVELYLEDGDEIYNVDLRYNLMSRNIFNSLLSLDSFSEIKLSLYTNKKGYPAVGVEQGGTRADWKYKLEDLPAVKKVLVGKKEMPDSTELDEFYLGELQVLAEKLDSANPKGEQSETATQDDKFGGDEDIPF